MAFLDKIKPINFLLISVVVLNIGCGCNSKRKISEIKKQYPSGKLQSIVEYKNGIKHGRSLNYYENGKIASKANYLNGHFYGWVTFYYSSGRKNHTEFYNQAGKSEGIFKLWYENGKLKQTGIYKDGKMIGRWYNYYLNGDLESSEFYNNNLKDSIWVYYSEKGAVIKKEYYKADSLIKKTLY